MVDFYRHVGQAIARLRRGKMTQKELSDRLSLSRTSLANIERGRQQLLLHHAVRIAEALDVELAALVPTPPEATGKLKETLRGLPDEQQKWVEAAVPKTMIRP